MMAFNFTDHKLYTQIVEKYNEENVSSVILCPRDNTSSIIVYSFLPFGHVYRCFYVPQRQLHLYVVHYSLPSPPQLTVDK